MTPEAKIDQRLKAAFAFDEPPARDYAFEAAVMQDVARRQLAMRLLMLVAPALAATAVLWAVAPQLEPLVESGLQSLQPILAGAFVGAFVTLLAWRYLKPLRA